MKMFRTVRKGFTLIEILVTVVVIGVLAAVVIPAVTQQATAGDAARIVQDIDNIRGGIETFAVNVRPKFPGDVEDLANAISSSVDKSLDGVLYDATDLARWKGPYIEKTAPAAGVATGDFSASGYSSFVQQAFTVCNSTEFNGCAASTTAGEKFVALTVSPLTSAQFETVNAIIDGGAEATSATVVGGASGKFRFALAGSSTVSGTAYYLGVPYRAP